MKNNDNLDFVKDGYTSEQGTFCMGVDVRR